jgi:hypothetical protein
MSRGRHALPEPPRSDAPLLVLALLVAAATVAAVWFVDTSWAVQVGVTGVVLLALLALWSVTRAAHEQAARLAAEANERRREQQRTLELLAEANAQLAEMRVQHVELMLELRTLRDAGVDQALMHELLLPREPAPEPVYPSLQLPLVRAAFAAELTPEPVDTAREMSPPLPREETTGAEPRPPRQLLDLTASEIARLRPAN